VKHGENIKVLKMSTLKFNIRKDCDLFRPPSILLAGEIRGGMKSWDYG
jgi:hypothetical protein